MGVSDSCAELGVDFVEGALEGGIDGVEAWKHGGDARTQVAVVEAGKEQGRAEVNRAEISGGDFA